MCDKIFNFRPSSIFAIAFLFLTFCFLFQSPMFDGKVGGRRRFPVSGAEISVANTDVFF